MSKRQLPYTHSCFVCGDSNPVGLKIRFETDGQAVETRYIPRDEHAGFKRTLHGGIIATVLDEIMVWACTVHTNRFAYCAELNVRYLAPAPPGGELIARGELGVNKRDRLYEAKGELRSLEGKVLATSTGKYIPLAIEETAEMLSDFVGDASPYLIKKAPDVV